MMVKQLYWYETEPGDKGHMEAYNFDAGVVEAEPEEVETIIADLASRGHDAQVTIVPIKDTLVSVARMREHIGQALSTYHSEVDDSELCPEDQTYEEEV